MKRGDRVIKCAACGQRLGVNRVVKDLGVFVQTESVMDPGRREWQYEIYPPGHVETRCVECAGPDGMSPELVAFWRRFHGRMNANRRHPEDPERELKASRAEWHAARREVVA